MSEHVYWVLEGLINPGKLDAFKALVEEMSAATKANEPGAVAYEWSLSPDGTKFHILEHYKNSAATATHIKNFGAHFAARFLGLVTPTYMNVYGTPNDEVREMLAGFGPSYYTHVAGFVR